MIRFPNWILRNSRNGNLIIYLTDCFFLYRESNLHDKIKAIFSIKKLIILRILKRFDTPRKATNIVHAEHTQKLQSDAIKMLKLQVTENCEF